MAMALEARRASSGLVPGLTSKSWTVLSWEAVPRRPRSLKATEDTAAFPWGLPRVQQGPFAAWRTSKQATTPSSQEATRWAGFVGFQARHSTSPESGGRSETASFDRQSRTWTALSSPPYANAAASDGWNFTDWTRPLAAKAAAQRGSSSVARSQSRTVLSADPDARAFDVSRFHDSAATASECDDSSSGFFVFFVFFVFFFFFFFVVVVSCCPRDAVGSRASRTSRFQISTLVSKVPTAAKDPCVAAAAPPPSRSHSSARGNAGRVTSWWT
mmetsp:Transcript_11553/g.37976  ORF Transcript_11553/g.37976 Transcript_11553/m.37976 type:complete len:272 (-) Transcript_11553:474-1289(-)